ncbi:MAG: hypothetical protein AB1797_05935 [bacterium]
MFHVICLPILVSDQPLRVSQKTPSGISLGRHINVCSMFDARCSMFDARCSILVKDRASRIEVSNNTR